MLKKITRIMCFLLGLAIILTIISKIMAPKSEVYNVYGVDSKLKEYKLEDDNTIDLIFLGDSESYSAFNPLQLFAEQGITSYVCGTALQKLCDTYSLIVGAFENQSPKVVVVEANCLYRNAGLYSEYSDKVTNVASKLIPVMKYHNIWKSYLPKEKLFNTNDSLLKGFKYRNDVMPYLGGDWMCETDVAEDIPDDVENYLIKIKDFITEKNAKLIIVGVPSPDNWSYGKHLGAKELAKALEIDFVDLNTSWAKIGIDWKTDTKDAGNHLNYNGAKKVTKYIGDMLSKMYDFEDHRNDSNYEKWYKDLANSGLEF